MRLIDVIRSITLIFTLLTVKNPTVQDLFLLSLKPYLLAAFLYSSDRAVIFITLLKDLLDVLGLL